MKKIPTLFDRDWDGDRSRVIDQVTPGCEWVTAGEGVPYQKLDGTCCWIDENGWLFKRREIKKGKLPPAGFVPCGDLDPVTGKLVGWVPVGDGPEDQHHREAFQDLLNPSRDETFELVGPKIQGNPEGYSAHRLYAHNADSLRMRPETPRTFEDLASYLHGRDIEGIVWHHPDGRMAKIKMRDFGLKRAPLTT